MNLNINPEEANYIYCSIIFQLITDGKADVEQLAPGLQAYLYSVIDNVGEEEPEHGTPEYNLKYYANNYFVVNKEEMN